MFRFRYVSWMVLVMGSLAQGAISLGSGLGFGVDFSIPLSAITPNMEQNNPLLPHCDVAELAADVQEISCRQGWLRGDSPRVVEVRFPGLPANASVEIIDSWDHTVYTTAGERKVQIHASEHESYDVRIQNGSESYTFTLHVLFYPVAP